MVPDAYNLQETVSQMYIFIAELYASQAFPVISVSIEVEDVVNECAVHSR